MADRRMFSKTIIDSDEFLDMPPAAQLLYFHLALRADDDGFLNRPKSIIRACGLSAGDMDALIDSGFVIAFESGVIAIAHWRVHNTVRKDRYKPTICPEMELLQLDEKSVYRLATDGCQTVAKAATQDSIGQDSIGQDSLGEDRTDEDRLGQDSLGEDRTDEGSLAEESAEQHSMSVGLSKNDDISDEGLGLSAEQCAELVEMSSVLSVETYLQKLSDWQNKSGKRCHDPYSTIKRWITEDKFRHIPPKREKKESSYDLEEYEKFAMSYDFGNAPWNNRKAE